MHRQTDRRANRQRTPESATAMPRTRSSTACRSREVPGTCCATGLIISAISNTTGPSSFFARRKRRQKELNDAEKTRAQAGHRDRPARPAQSVRHGISLRPERPARPGRTVCSGQPRDRDHRNTDQVNPPARRQANRRRPNQACWEVTAMNRVSQSGWPASRRSGRPASTRLIIRLTIFPLKGTSASGRLVQRSLALLAIPNPIDRQMDPRLRRSPQFHSSPI